MLDHVGRKFGVCDAIRQVSKAQPVIAVALERKCHE